MKKKKIARKIKERKKERNKIGKNIGRRGARGVMVSVVGNGHGDTSSNPGRD